MPFGVGLWGKWVEDAAQNGNDDEGDLDELQAMREVLMESDRVPGMATRWYVHPADYESWDRRRKTNWETSALATAAGQLVADQEPRQVAFYDAPYSEDEDFDTFANHALEQLLRERVGADNNTNISFAECRFNRSEDSCRRGGLCHWDGRECHFDDSERLPAAIQEFCSTGDRESLARLAMAMLDAGLLFGRATDSRYGFLRQIESLRNRSGSGGSLDEESICASVAVGYAFLQAARRRPRGWLLRLRTFLRDTQRNWDQIVLDPQHQAVVDAYGEINEVIRRIGELFESRRNYQQGGFARTIEAAEKRWFRRLDEILIDLEERRLIPPLTPRFPERITRRDR